MNDLLSISQLTAKDILGLLDTAQQFKEKGIPFAFGKESRVVATLFFEASTRTRLSFESAAHRLGAGVVGFADPAATSFAQKGESFEDTIRMIDAYADAIVIRHPENESVHIAADIAQHPIINAGNGTGEHPTQVLTDLFTMRERHGSLDGLRVAIVGDLKYGRVPHSLAKALALFPNTKQIWVHPPQLPMPEDVTEYVKDRGAEFEESNDLAYAIANADVVYMTRVQAERFENPEEYEQLKDAYILSPDMLAQAPETLAIMHALPRRYELPETIDVLPQALYFTQAANAVPVRAALLHSVLTA